jgi:coatomer protein complex subunit gamma
MIYVLIILLFYLFCCCNCTFFIIIENAVVRAAAVSTLGAFALRVPELRPSLSVLLRRSLSDDDDEVRDRAALLLGE